MNFFISLSPTWWGGGSNTFTYNFCRWAKVNGLHRVRRIEDATFALVIAGNATEEMLQSARRRGVFLIHRLDEYFEPQETEYRQEKHRRIVTLNQLTDVTVFQSEFVRDNVLPHLKPRQWTIILNGGHPKNFSPAREPGRYIGHVTWGVGEKKRLDLLEKAIQQHPTEQFLLVGNHRRSTIPFNRYANVRLAGRVWRPWMPGTYRKMKTLYFPSENDPCPNTAVEAVLSGVPLAYNPLGGTKEIVKSCGLPLEQFSTLLGDLGTYRARCLQRSDLHFEKSAQGYVDLFRHQKQPVSQ